MAGAPADPRREASILLAHVLGRPSAWLHAHGDDPVPELARRRYELLIERRASGEPAAYLMGRREFWSLDLEITPAVLVPRPETERLVEIALECVPASSGFRVADLGTGSGAIALALARERPGCHVIATDISAAALALAASNAARLGLRNIEFRRGRWCAALGAARPELIVANPPYVARGDPHIRDDGLRFEPRDALVAGEDGLDAVREIVCCAPRYLPPAGRLLLEHGAEQGEAIRSLLEASGFRDVVQYRDHAGRERALCACAPPGPRPLPHAP